MDFSNIVTKVPHFDQTVVFLPASAEDPPSLVQVQVIIWLRISSYHVLSYGAVQLEKNIILRIRYAYRRAFCLKSRI